MNCIKNNIPNGITCINLICGAMACLAAARLREPIIGDWQGYQLAYILLAVAAVADFLDGLVARAIGAASAIGKELDSLCDLVSFGLAPALMVYYMIEPQVGLWALTALLIAVGGALRLARFNVDTNQTTTFTGLPIPANAIFWVGYTALAINSDVPLWVTFASIVVLPCLMVSPLRMFSLKIHDFSPRVIWPQLTLLIGTLCAVTILGVPGLAVAITLYVVLALLHREH